VTARTTTLIGADAGRYYVEHELDYYLDRGEPPGRWLGRAAERLGLDGPVDEEDFLALMAGLDPSTGRLLGTAHTDRTARGYDVTCSAPKSVSVLYAVGGGVVRAQVTEAHDAAVRAVVEWIESHAQTRYRVNGQVCVFDAGGIVAAAFRQHASRALDPQLHTHLVIANRVPSPDGRWLALDARTIKQDQQTLSRLYHAGLRTELTRRFGIRWRDPVNGIAEIADVAEPVLREFSQRTEAIDARIEDRIEQFHDTFDRAPTPRERWRLERHAVLDTRPKKQDTDPLTLDAEWTERARALGVTPERLAAKAIGRARSVARLDGAVREQITEAGLAALAEKQSTWRVAELIRELAAAVPTTAALPAGDLAPWLDDLADEIVLARMVDLSRPAPAGVSRRRDGRPITEGATDRRLTTPEILAQEERLLAIAHRRVADGGNDHQVTQAEELAPAQRALATGVAGERSLVLAVGPAGTGKTTALRPAVEQLRREGRAVFGVAPSATAAEVLAVDSGVHADTIDKLLIEHRLDRPPDHSFDLPAGATVIVDEAAMVSTQRLAELFELAEQKGWRLALVGDPLQFSAVGRSGMFGHLVYTFDAIELGRVHRFTDAWEAKASLRLRRGDVSVVEEYDERGRLHGGTERRMRTAAVRAWWDAAGRGESACLTAPTNAAVVALNNEAQRRRLDAGQLDADGKSRTVGPYRVHVGDVVATRQNDRNLVTDRHLMVKNRDRWTIEAIHRDGAITVDGRTGRVRLPGAYVAEHVELAYAQTCHASQGRTVGRSFLYLDAPTGAAGIYVPMTRGRESNEAFVVIRGEETPADVVAEALTRTWIDRPAVAVRAELRSARSTQDDGDGRDRLERPLGKEDLGRLLGRAAVLDRTITGAQTELEMARHRLVSLARDRAALSRSIEEYEARLANARRTVAELDRPLVRRRHRIELDSARNQIDWVPRSIHEARERLAQADVKERQSAEQLLKATAVDKTRPQLMAEQAVVRNQLDHDARLRGERLATAPSEQVLERFGPQPASEAGRLWVEAVGRVAQHRDAFDQHGKEILGRSPRLLHDDVYATSYWATRQVVERAERALGRELAIEPPHRSLGISR
jgi:conjugative relaxase-like TrwC/TraI family protein